MLNETAENIAISIVDAMDSINRSKKYSEIELKNWQEGRIAGLYNALYSTMLVGRE